MATQKSIGTFFQGQTLSIVVSSPSDATDEEKAMLKDNDLYLGIYGPLPNDKKILSSQDGTIVKQTDDTTGITTLACVLSASDTKKMIGHYAMEMLIKNSDNSFTSPCENIVTFDIERRRISEVIK